jgi:hypothetical protein
MNGEVTEKYYIYLNGMSDALTEKLTSTIYVLPLLTSSRDMPLTRVSLGVTEK